MECVVPSAVSPDSHFSALNATLLRKISKFQEEFFIFFDLSLCQSVGAGVIRYREIILGLPPAPRSDFPLLWDHSSEFPAACQQSRLINLHHICHTETHELILVRPLAMWPQFPFCLFPVSSHFFCFLTPCSLSLFCLSLSVRGCVGVCPWDVQSAREV